MAYIVIELQTTDGGQVANLVTAHETRAEAESKYHTVLAAAAVSGLAAHAAVLMTNEGYVLDQRCYTPEGA